MEIEYFISPEEHVWPEVASFLLPDFLDFSPLGSREMGG
jgi:hypothetical protein